MARSEISFDRSDSISENRTRRLMRFDFVDRCFFISTSIRSDFVDRDFFLSPPSIRLAPPPLSECGSCCGMARSEISFDRSDSISENRTRRLMRFDFVDRGFFSTFDVDPTCANSPDWCFCRSQACRSMSASSSDRSDSI